MCTGARTNAESFESFNEDRHNFEYFLQFYLQGSKDQDQSHLMTNLMTLVVELPQTCFYLEMCLSLPSLYVKLLEEWYRLLIDGKQPTCKIVELLCLLGHEKRKVGNPDQYKDFLQKAIKLHRDQRPL